jgi:hypothetical protein
MNVIKLLVAIKDLFVKGNAIRGSGILTNAEAGAAALYAFLSALVLLLKSLGIEVPVEATDLHLMADGYAIGTVTIYSVWRVISNKESGFSLSFSKDAESSDTFHVV